MAIDLQNRVVIVTGASRGLGRAMAEGLADAGARVVLAAPEATVCAPPPPRSAPASVPRACSPFRRISPARRIAGA